MKKLNILCIIGILAVSCFALSFSSQADELEDLYGNPEKSYYFVFATGAIQGSFGTMETCVYCHGNGGKGTSEGRKRGAQILQMQHGRLQKQMRRWLSFWNPMTKVAQSAEEEFQLTQYRNLLT